MISNEAKTAADFLITDFENEMQTTLRVMEAVPTGHLDYRPDSKYTTALGLVRHLVLEDEWLLNRIANGEFTPLPSAAWEQRSRGSMGLSPTLSSDGTGLPQR